MRKRLSPYMWTILLLSMGCSGSRDLVSKKQAAPKEARISCHEFVEILDGFVKEKKKLWFLSGGVCHGFDLIRSFETGSQIHWLAERTIVDNLTCKRTTHSFHIIYGPEESVLMVGGPTSHTDDLEGCVPPGLTPEEGPGISSTHISITNCLRHFRIVGLENNRLLLRSSRF